MLSLESVKQHLKVEFDDDDEKVIKPMILAAEGALKFATGKKTTDYLSSENKELACMACKLLIGHWYENRSAVAIGTITKEMEFTVSNIYFQLKYGEDVADESGETEQTN